MTSSVEMVGQVAVKLRHNPLLFVTDVLGATPEPWQVEALEAIAVGDRVSVRSGHGVGKTTWFAWLVLWFLSTRHPAKIAVAANSQDQLKDTVWPEISAWHKRLPEHLRNRIEITGERVTVKGVDAFATARTVNKNNPEGLQGFHSENMLYLVDEASGIPDIAYDVARGAMSTPGAKTALAGNPTRSNGFFYRTHHNLRADWHCIKVSSEDVPRARGHIDDIIKDYGEGSNQYRVRVLGEFPTEDDDTILPLSLVEGAVGREVGQNARSMVWGLDVARFGDDRSALAKRKGNIMSDAVMWWHGSDTMQTVSKVLREWDQTPEGEKPAAINVDVIGIGAGVLDRLRQLGLPARAVNVGEAATDKTGRYQRLNDELWFKCREWFMEKDCQIAKDDLLISELTGRKYDLSPNGKLRIESKDDMKKRGLRSPDVADAFILTFAGGDYASNLRNMTQAQIDYDPTGNPSEWSRGRQQSAGMEYDPF